MGVSDNFVTKSNSPSTTLLKASHSSHLRHVHSSHSTSHSTHSSTHTNSSSTHTPWATPASNGSLLASPSMRPSSTHASQWSIWSAILTNTILSSTCNVLVNRQAITQATKQICVYLNLNVIVDCGRIWNRPWNRNLKFQENAFLKMLFPDSKKQLYLDLCQGQPYTLRTKEIDVKINYFSVSVMVKCSFEILEKKKIATHRLIMKKEPKKLG